MKISSINFKKGYSFSSGRILLHTSESKERLRKCYRKKINKVAEIM